MADPKLDDDKKKESVGSSVGKAAPRGISLTGHATGGDTQQKLTPGVSLKPGVYAPTTKHDGLFGGAYDMTNDIGRSFFNFIGSVSNGLTGKKEGPVGGGWGDSIYGSNASDGNKLINGAPSRKMIPPVRNRAQAEGPEFTQAMSFADALAQAMDLLGQYGGDDGGYGYSDIPFVNYDPQRNEARGRASEADIRLGAMYDQLTAAGRAYQSQLNDFASRGMLQSQGYADANSDLQRLMNDQYGQMATNKTNFMTGMERALSNYKGENTSSQQAARAEAIARRAAQYGL